MTETIITYETIYETLRKEKYEPELQLLPPSFFNYILNYLKEKQDLVDSQKKSQNLMFSGEIEKTEKQIQNVKRLLKELYERRENKIIQLALFSSRTSTKIDLSSLLEEEQKFYKSILVKLNNYRKGILLNLLSLKEPEIDKPKDIKTETQESTKLVRFLKDVPKFMGEDLNIYGPFTEDDIASIPQKVASLLIKKNRAKQIKL